MPVEIQFASSAAMLPTEQQVGLWADQALGSIERPQAELCLRVVDELEMTELNHTYRGKDKPTNVLSFPADISLPEADLLGDVVICAPVVAQEARVQGKTYGDHFAHMVVHGVLHLGGHDHEDEREAEVMEALEVQILAELSIANPYR